MTDIDIAEVTPGRYRISGELDMASAKVLNERLEPIAGAGAPLTLDIENLTFIDSSGLRALIQLSAQLDGSGPLVLSNPPTGVRRLLDIVGLEALPGIKVQDDV